MGQLKKIDFSKVKNINSIPKEFIGWSCRKLKELIIPYGVTEIEDDAFRYSYALKRLFLPPTLKIIGDLMREDDEGYPLRTGLSVFCYSPSLEELEPIVYGWDDEEDLEEEEEESALSTVFEEASAVSSEGAIVLPSGGEGGAFSWLLMIIHQAPVLKMYSTAHNSTTARNQ